MEDNYRFLKENNLDELYACVCEVENLYKKGMYKQIPQECRKALEIEIEEKKVTKCHVFRCDISFLK